MQSERRGRSELGGATSADPQAGPRPCHRSTVRAPTLTYHVSVIERCVQTTQRSGQPRQPGTQSVSHLFVMHPYQAFTKPQIGESAEPYNHSQMVIQAVHGVTQCSVTSLRDGSDMHRLYTSAE